MTNFEKIKQMSVEEFVDRFGENCLCDYIHDNYKGFCDKHNICILDECCIEWLASEVDTEQKEGKYNAD